MAVRDGLLALLADGASYGYELKLRYEAVTAGMWPLNIGQVYTSLERLERDGLVAKQGQDAEGRVMYSLTEAGRGEVDEWFAQPPSDTAPPRDDLTLKIAIALSSDSVDAEEILESHKDDLLRALQRHNRVLRKSTDPATTRIAELRIYSLEAHIRWLDNCLASLTTKEGTL